MDTCVRLAALPDSPQPAGPFLNAVRISTFTLNPHVARRVKKYDSSHGASYVGPSSVFRRRRVCISFSCDISHVCAGVRVTLVDLEHPATIATMTD